MDSGPMRQKRKTWAIKGKETWENPHFIKSNYRYHDWALTSPGTPAFFYLEKSAHILTFADI